MLKEEKEKNYRDFILSQTFTLPSFSSLSLFQMNVNAMNTLVRQESDLALKLIDSNTERFELSYIQLDILSKVMMMIEGQVALILALESARKHIAERMSFFSSRAVEELATKLDGYSQDQRRAFMWKVLSLPDANTLLNLSEEERLFLNQVLNETAEIRYEVLCGCVNFYRSNKIAYNKFKHGLSFLPLAPLTQVKNQNALLLALHKGKDKPEHQVNLLSVKGSFIPKAFQWFNTVCIIEISRKNVETYAKMSESIDDFVSFTVQNNLLYAENCGADYLPLRIIEDNKIEPWLYPRNMTQDVIDRIKTIYSKSLPNIRVTPKREGKFEIHFDKAIAMQIGKLLDFVGSAVIFAGEENAGSARVLNEVEMK